MAATGTKYVDRRCDVLGLEIAIEGVGKQHDFLCFASPACGGGRERSEAGGGPCKRLGTRGGGRAHRRLRVCGTAPPPPPPPPPAERGRGPGAAANRPPPRARAPRPATQTHSPVAPAP